MPFFIGREDTMQRELTPQQKNLISALIHHHVISEAAASIGLSAPTARNWMNLPFMQTAYEAARREYVTAHIERVRAGNFDEVIAALKSRSPEEGAAFERNVQLAQRPDIRSRPDVQAVMKSAIEQYIAPLHVYLNMPITQALSWK